MAGRLYDAAFDQWLEVGHYASRPPGEVHGPFKTNDGCIVLEVSFPNRIQQFKATTLLNFRPAIQADLHSLWEFLAIAAYEPDAAAAQAIPMVAAHVEGWQRHGDFGVIAERNGAPVGAAWARQFTVAENPVFYVDNRTPEISIGVWPELRGQGVGQQLLEALLAEARVRKVGLCLNVRDRTRRCDFTSGTVFEPFRVQRFPIGLAVCRLA